MFNEIHRKGFTTLLLHFKMAPADTLDFFILECLCGVCSWPLMITAAKAKSITLL